MKYCTKCGHPSPPDALFCEQCGNKLYQEQTKIITEPQPSSTTSRNIKKWLFISGITIVAVYAFKKAYDREQVRLANDRAVANADFSKPQIREVNRNINKIMDLKAEQGSNEVKKLPSKIINFLGDETYKFYYDEHNRLIKIVSNSYYRANREIIYDTIHNHPTAIIKNENDLYNFDYDNNQVFIFGNNSKCSEILTIDFDNLSTIKFSSHYPDLLMIYYTDEMIVKTSFCEQMDYIPSDIKSIWRHVNVSNWFLIYISVDAGPYGPFHFLPFPLGKNGNMPEQYTRSQLEEVILSYELDEDGYVKQIIEERLRNGKRVLRGREIATIEYIFAK